MTRELEHRSRVRITWRFWVAVEGIDDFPRLRQGNISASGIFIETDRHLGGPGEVQWLHLAANEQEAPLGVMARVMRITRDPHLLHAPAAEGVALEFMPEDDATRDALLQLVRKIATIRMEVEEGSAGPGLLQTERGGPGVQRLTLETSLPLAVGQVLRLTLETDEGSETVQLRGRVAQVVPLTRAAEATTSRVSVQVIDAVRPRPAAPAGLHAVPTHETTAIQLQLDDVVSTVADEARARAETEAEEQGSGDLVGSLARVKLARLLAFLERSGLSGELRLETDDRRAVVFIRDGHMIDVESTPPTPTPRTALAQVAQWSSGSFHFVAREVQREDRLQIRSSRLLL